jgi:hypothetical protein
MHIQAIIMPLFVDMAGGYVGTLERDRTWLKSKLNISIVDEVDTCHRFKPKALLKEQRAYRRFSPLITEHPRGQVVVLFMRKYGEGTYSNLNKYTQFEETDRDREVKKKGLIDSTYRRSSLLPAIEVQIYR